VLFRLIEIKNPEPAGVLSMATTIEKLFSNGYHL